MADKIKHRHQYKRLSDGAVFEVELEIDVDEVCRLLAARAIGSKLGKSQALNGDIKCKVINATSPVG
jgi:hypothetical protein